MKQAFAAVGALVIGLVLMSGCGADQTRTFDGQMTDPRDGQTYRTRVVGKLEWMMENLRFATDTSWCAPQDSACAMGRLYPWSQAMQACPEGWRLPAIGELGEFVERFSPGWRSKANGPRQAFLDLEPLLQPAGFHQPWTGRFVDYGQAATLWTSDEFGLSAAMGLVWSRPHETVEITPLSKEAGHACRCVRKASDSPVR